MSSKVHILSTFISIRDAAWSHSPLLHGMADWFVLECETEFYSRVVKGRPEECWMWGGPKSGTYGVFNFRGMKDSAHAVAFVLTYGPVPEGKEVSHKCHNGWCVNPSHLKAATHEENVLESLTSGRRRGGMVRRLTEEDVLYIHDSMLNRTSTVHDLAVHLNVLAGAIRDAVNGNTHKKTFAKWKQLRGFPINYQHFSCVSIGVAA